MMKGHEKIHCKIKPIQDDPEPIGKKRRQKITSKAIVNLRYQHNTKKEVTTFLAKDRPESPTHSGFPRFWARKKFLLIEEDLNGKQEKTYHHKIHTLTSSITSG